MPSDHQHWNPEQYSQNARFVSELGLPVVELLAPQAGERILDLGCGDGVLSLKLMGLGCQVLGIDASAEMVQAAHARGLEARVGDGHSLSFSNEFNAVFSNAALHWMLKPQRVIAEVWQALKPGGRFVGEMGGYGNVASIVKALEVALNARGMAVPKPWYFPRPQEYQTLLEAQGFLVNVMELIPRPTLLPGDLSGWLLTFAQAYLAGLSASDKPGFINEVLEALRPQLGDTQGIWHADYVRLRFKATKPVALAR